jgi:hypothetical protein
MKKNILFLALVALATLLSQCGSDGGDDPQPQFTYTKVSTFATIGKPTSIAKDSKGNFFIADFDAHVIRKITADGTQSIFAGQEASEASYFSLY